MTSASKIKKTKSPKVFLSFATEDLDFVTKLFSRLKRLGVDIWDYSDRKEEIPLGKEIKKSLEKHILSCEYFIPIISSNSVSIKKTCIQFELKIAVEQNKKCFPVIISKRIPGEWVGAFEFISDRKYLEIDDEDEIRFEEKICELCASLNVIYEPDIEDPNRLPIYRRLQKEIKCKLSQIKVIGERYIYDKLMRLIGKFNLAYSLGEWSIALETIKYFLSFNKEELNNTAFYYPLIVKGACELQLGLAEDAKKTFTEAVNHTEADENAFGGLAQVWSRTNNFKEALTQYKTALSKCPVGLEAEVSYNLLLTAVEVLNNEEDINDKELLVEALNIINNAGYVEKLESKPYPHKKERIRVDFLLGLVFYKRMNYKKAISYLEGIYNSSVFQISADLFLSGLNSKMVSKELQHKFRENGFLIPGGLVIQECSFQSNTEIQEFLWIIIDGESIYLLHLNDRSIDIYYRELALIIYFSEILEKIHDKKRALEILKKNATILNSRLLFHHYANLLARYGYINSAKEIFRLHLCQPPYDRQFLIENALILRSLRETAEMKKNCDLVIKLGLPEDRRDCYYRGFAYYLLCREELANVYYNDSLSYSKYYKDVI